MCTPKQVFGDVVGRAQHLIYCRYPTLHIAKTEESIKNLLSQTRPRGGSTISQAKGIRELHKHSYAENKEFFVQTPPQT